MLKVKICGLTRPGDAVLCAEEGADYVGLIFAKSPRHVDVKAAKAVLKVLPKGVEGVGVFMDQPLDEVRRFLGETGLGIAQLHGSESPDYAAALGVAVIKTFDTFSEPALERLKAYDAFAFLLDLPKGAGPRGRAAIDHEWALLAKRHGKVMLAGKLDASNVGELVRRVRPWGVDTARATEASPGVKDPAKVREFIRAARLAHKDTTKIKVRTRR
jgi:phosphoribosylanthranilate isomerase